MQGREVGASTQTRDTRRYPRVRLRARPRAGSEAGV